MDINLSTTLEQALLQIVKKRQREEWLAQNRAAIDAYNDIVTPNARFDAWIIPEL